MSDVVINFQSEIYKNNSMTASEAREWLNSMPLNNLLVHDVITKIANGEYPRILDEIDQFIKILARSKHNETGGLLKDFSDSMVDKTMIRINLCRHSHLTAGVLLANNRWRIHDQLNRKKLDYEVWRSSRAAAKQK
jgi:hypothetical protein